jgi:hypothetical protein
MASKHVNPAYGQLPRLVKEEAARGSLIAGNLRFNPHNTNNRTASSDLAWGD